VTFKDLQKVIESQSSSEPNHLLQRFRGKPFWNWDQNNEDDCNFVMHYLSGQYEEQTAKGVNVTQICDTFLSRYLGSRDLLTNDFPTDTKRFSALLDEFKQNVASEEQQRASKEANKPSWAENLERE
jgi:hypothetical protein